MSSSTLPHYVFSPVAMHEEEEYNQQSTDYRAVFMAFLRFLHQNICCSTAVISEAVWSPVLVRAFVLFCQRCAVSKQRDKQLVM